ncbi:neuraminidase-like domain-containing protein [Collimonas antrihumi]|uniref:Tc toxin subunit A-related protein n=1 Tax=Collimonas antrihumi TaxID=1940615 RepID=UPI001B8D0022|nr:neuraminidase-like domain-containing protein [Collimonas antrihumi]
MLSKTHNIDTRINTLNAVFGTPHDQKIVSAALQSANGNWSDALNNLKDKLPEASLQKATLVHSLAAWSGDNIPVVAALARQPDMTNLRAVALNYNVDKLATLVDPNSVPANIAGATPAEKQKNFAITLQNNLFTAEPSAVLQRMVQDAEVPIADANLRSGTVSFLNNQPDFNIRTTSIYTALQHPDAFNGIADENRAGVVEQMKTLQRVQAISPVPTAVPVLIKANLTSAFRIAEIPESTFMAAHGNALGEETAQQVYTGAINLHIRNEHALMTMREVSRGTGLAMMDGSQPMEARMAALQGVADAHAVPLDLETLFGGMDYCACDDCLSVYSPAAYFVEILQYLRNNDLDPKKAKSDPKDISNTPLENLLRRRPDLGCLELTCENTFTVLPYIDLVNEVMESFVVHLDKYKADANSPKQATLEVFNVTDETTSELLAEPQHINYKAYCILKDAVYPFTLPYHQPIDAARIFLKYMGSSRYEVLDTFRTATEIDEGAALSPPQLQQLKALHGLVQQRAVDAEFLGITQEEYIILTREAFWPKVYFELTQQQVYTDDDYRQKIGVRPVHEYYGCKTEAEMLSVDETAQLGLTFVKKQFLPRTGIAYVDLIELVKTRFINPAFPQGRALAILENIRFSYRFLQTLVDTNSNDRNVRFAKLIAFLDGTQPLVPKIDALLHPDPCHQQGTEHCLCETDFHDWVLCYFERIGKLIVLESGEGPQLPVEGQLFKEDAPPTYIGTLHKDGTVVDKNGVMIGNVTITGQLVGTDGKPFIEQFGTSELLVENANGDSIAFVDAMGLRGPREQRLNWLPARDTCDLDKVRLTHLDGSVLSVGEYDRMQCFIRLWRKLGWSIAETDLALIGSGGSAVGVSVSGAVTVLTADGGSVGFDIFQSDCSTVSDGNAGGCCDTPEHNDDSNCPALVKVPENISMGFLHQLVAIRQLLDLTGMPLDKMLSFWADISTSGEKSLYSRLFLTHNLLGIDKIFASDANGNYLTQAAKMADHMPVLIAALKMKADDVAAIVKLRQLTDVLTLANVSALYRHSLLAKILHVPVVDLSDVFTLFGDPFKSAEGTLAFLHNWGKMEDAGFTYRQLDYVIHDQDDLKRPLAPAKKTILQISKALYDGLQAIDRDHQDVPLDQKDQASADRIRTEAGLLFDPSVVEQIINLLEGTSIYTTNAPVNQVITLLDTDTLKKKLKYSNQKDAIPPSASIQVTGILTDAEKVQAKALSNDADWAKAIDRVGKKALQFFNDSLLGIFPNNGEAIATLLTGDINVAPDPNKPGASDANTGPIKRSYFLQFFLPFLRQRLAHRLIVSNLAGSVGTATDVTDTLLNEVLLIGASKQHAIDILEKIHQKPAASGNDWKGYLIPAIDDAYTFVAQSLVGDTQPPAIVIDGQVIPFTLQQEDPTNFWSTDPATPVKLKNGKSYALEVSGQPATNLQWRTSSSPTAFIPALVLLPDYSSDGTEEVFVKLVKAALIVKGFNLTVDEVSYWQTNGADFAADAMNFDFNAITLGHWYRLQAYASLRDQLPKTEMTLLALFKWAGKPDDAAKLSEKIDAVTLWDKRDIKKLMAPEHFDLDHPEAFHNEINLIKLQKALQISTAIGTDIDRLFEWANPVSKFSVCHQIAEDIRATLRARYDQEDWELVVKPLNDQLREDQKQALIRYLVVQPDLREWGVVDADSLFEFFLIDVQMCACMDTSRIKQAISSVQLFVQRCLLGLEIPYGVGSEVLDRDRWDWMQKYRVWEANRKVYLYPENWIKTTLRDDKSSFFKELESELLQKDVNTQTVEDALKAYLFKVDEVANLKVVGLFQDDAGNKLHIFSRTRNAPYFYYYRYFRTDERNWYPWEKMQLDIPTYDMEGANGQITKHGSYLTPVVWNSRLLIFFPQFMKKAAPNPAIGNNNFETTAKTKSPSDCQSIEYWEIKMGWSEYRNEKWTQKQISAEAIYNNPNQPNALPDINSHQFIPRFFSTPSSQLAIAGYEGSKILGAFLFSGSQLSTFTGVIDAISFTTDFHYTNGTDEIHSLQAIDNEEPSKLTVEPYFETPQTNVTAHVMGATFPFYHVFAHELLGKVAAGGLDTLFDYYANKIPDDSATIPHKVDAFGGDAQPVVYHELKRPYSLYNWEAAFHAPMLLVDRLLAAQQFDQALKMCHYVLNPYAAGTDAKRFWQFPPFKEVDATGVLEKLFSGLQPNQPNQQINEWRDKPFQPHVVARSRPSAYMKWVAMKYIEILIAYGDYYFRQNTLETIPLAIQCFVLASHHCGTRGQKIPKSGKTLPQTYNSLLDKWDAFGNAMVELELAFPFSNQTPLPIGVSNGVVGLANVFGFASTLYFCIPDNPQLTALRETIDDRLFKIRHCEDIDGVFRQLPLFEPPIDPALLVQAAAQGLSLSSVLNDMNSPMPNYRFYYLLQKALELCSEVKALGGAFMAIKEKTDAEDLSQIRARHESSIHNLVMEVKKQQLDEAGKSLDALQQSRKGPVYRLQHFIKLIGEDLGKVPDENTDFSEFADTIEQPVDESGLKLISYEKQEMDKASESSDWQTGIGVVETLASVFHGLPTINSHATPLGVGAAISWGFPNMGNATQSIARGLKIHGDYLSYQSSNAGRKAGFLRQLQERVQQANVAGYEIKNIDKQILTQQIRISIAQQEITNQQKQIDNAQEVEEFLRNKYTKKDLYSWMDNQVSTLWHQAYNMAYDMANRAEKVFRFERGLTSSNFIQYGYWDAAYDGLYSGERLYSALKQLEAAYQEKRGHDYEISKSISLRQIDPLALIQLKETGSCEFALPEVLFDMDYPGHYMRRIKSVSLRIPCTIGPYTSLNCTLRLLEHKFRSSAIAKGKGDYPEQIDQTDARFNTVNVPITSIAVSSLDDESGVFELNFHDERYLPFEGGGAISKWRLELPEKFRQFDYDTVTDVFMRLRYTSVGDDKLKAAAAGSVQDYIASVENLSREEGLFAIFDLKNDFPNEWYSAGNLSAGATERVLTIKKLNEKLPIFTKGRPPERILAKNIYLFVSGAIPAASIVATQGGIDITFLAGKSIGSMRSFVANDVEVPLGDLQIKIHDTTTVIDKMLLLQRYVLA